MEIIEINIDEIKPYTNNPRINDNAVNEVIESIKNYGIQQPLVVDKDNIIIVGHTRYKALKQMNFKNVPCVIAENLTEEKAKAYRIADNKTNEFAKWDFEKLQKEFEEIESYTGFTDSEIDDLLNDVALLDEEETEANKGGHLHESGNSVVFNFHTYRFTYNDNIEIVEKIKEMANKITDSEDEELKNRCSEIILNKMLESLEELEEII